MVARRIAYCSCTRWLKKGRVLCDTCMIHEQRKQLASTSFIPLGKRALQGEPEAGGWGPLRLYPGAPTGTAGRTTGSCGGGGGGGTKKNGGGTGPADAEAFEAAGGVPVDVAPVR